MINLLYLKLISLSTETGGTKKKKKRRSTKNIIQ